MDTIANGTMIHASTGGRPFDAGLPTVVLIHGAGMDHTVWQFQSRAIAHHGFNVLALDLPGHGRSGDPAPTSIGAFAEIVASFLTEVGVSSVHVVGHSMGALIGIELAASHPGLVGSLSLLGVAERMAVHPDLLDAAQRNDHLAFDLVASWSLARPAHLGNHPTPGLWMMGATVRLLERSRPSVLFTDLAACNAYEDAPARAPAISIPVCILMGSDDLMTRPKHAAALGEAFPNATMVTVPGAGHMLMVERPTTTTTTLLSTWPH